MQYTFSFEAPDKQGDEPSEAATMLHRVPRLVLGSERRRIVLFVVAIVVAFAATTTSGGASTAAFLVVGRRERRQREYDFGGAALARNRKRSAISTLPLLLSRRSSSSSDDSDTTTAAAAKRTNSGRVEDIDQWIRWSSESLRRCTGRTLYQEMRRMAEEYEDEDGGDESDVEEDPSYVHDNERFCVLSHGVQDDPIYCYFNKAALECFGFPEDAVYQLPRWVFIAQKERRTANQQHACMNGILQCRI